MLALSTKTKIVVIIPAYNEVVSIGKVINRIKESVECEIVVVDDGSTDDTGKVAEDLGVKVVRLKRNQGLSVAFRTGFKAGLGLGADILVNIDADNQYQPEEIPQLIEPILKGEADLVLGSRFTGTIEEMPWVKRFGNRTFTWLMRRITGFPFTDTQTGFRAFTAELASDLYLFGKYTYTQEMLIQTVEKGYRIVEVPSYFAKREHGGSRLIVNPFSYAFRAFSIVLKSYRDYHPLKTFGLIGLLFIGSGFVLGTYLLYIWVSTGIVGRIPSTILTMLLITSGILVLILGFLADMIKNVRDEFRDSIRLLESKIRKEDEEG